MPMTANPQSNSLAVSSSARGEWLVPTLLIMLSAVPVAAGTVRLVHLAGGAEITPDNARFFAAPLPVVLHIISVTLYCVLGAFQFAPDFRRRKPNWHRAAGRILVPCGLIAAISGLWMTQFYPPVDGDGPILYGMRLLVGSAMVLFICLGLAAILRRDIPRHRAWMMRGYALGLGAGTQALTHLPWFLFPAIQGEVTRALSMGAGWAINVVVAEWIIRGRPTHRSRTSAPTNSGDRVVRRPPRPRRYRFPATYRLGRIRHRGFGEAVAPVRILPETRSVLFASMRYGGVLMRLARFTARFAYLTVLAFAVVLAQQLAKIADDREGISYKLLAANKTKTIQKEMNEAAALGYEFSATMTGPTLGGNEVVVVMSKSTDTPANQRYEYKLLATSKTSTMQKELRQAGAEGFHYCDQSVAETAFGGQEVVIILQREIGSPHKTYFYKLLATTRTNTMEKELNQAGEEGFELMGLTVSKTAFGGQELVSILMSTSD